MGLFSVLIGYVIEGAFGRAVKELLYAGAGRPIAAMKGTRNDNLKAKNHPEAER